MTSVSASFPSHTIPSHTQPAMRFFSPLPKLLAAPTLAALASILFLFPVRIAYAQEDKCQTKGCWFEVVELLSSSDTLTIFFLSIAAISVANTAIGKDKKEKELKIIAQKLKTTEKKLSDMEDKEKNELREELKILAKRTDTLEAQKKSQPAEEEKKA